MMIRLSVLLLMLFGVVDLVAATSLEKNTAGIVIEEPCPEDESDVGIHCTETEFKMAVNNEDQLKQQRRSLETLQRKTKRFNFLSNVVQRPQTLQNPTFDETMVNDSMDAIIVSLTEAANSLNGVGPSNDSVIMAQQVLVEASQLLKYNRFTRYGFDVAINSLESVIAILNEAGCCTFTIAVLKTNILFLKFLRAFFPVKPTKAPITAPTQAPVMSPTPPVKPPTPTVPTRITPTVPTPTAPKAPTSPTK